MRFWPIAALLPSVVQAQTPPAGTPVPLMVMREVDGGVARPGDRVDLKTTAAVGTVPSGSAAWGVVTRAEPSGRRGMPGALSIELRYVEAAGQRIRLDGHRAVRGRDARREATIQAAPLGVLAPLGLMMRGRDARLRAGEEIIGFVAPPGALGPSQGLPPGMRIALVLDETLSSETAVRGARVAMRLEEDIVVAGRIVARAGTPGFGEVTIVEPRAAYGRGGRIAVAPLGLTLDNGTVRLRGREEMRGSGVETRLSGRNVFASAAAVALTGRSAELRAGTRIEAIVRGEGLDGD